MITIPEGMGFEALGDDQRLIDSVSRKNPKPYAVLPGTIRNKYDTDRDWAYDAAREGEPPQKFRVADMDLVERPVKQKYWRTRAANSIEMPTQTVRIVGPNTIAPATDDPNLSPVRGQVVAPMPQDIMAKGQVDIYSGNEEFEAQGPIIDLPGFPGRNSKFRDLPSGVLRQSFPARSDMQMPDGLIYDQASNVVPGWDERQEAHEQYAEEGEAAASNMGVLRVGDDMQLEQLDIIASVASSVIAAGATGYGIYSKIAADKREKKAQADASRQQAIQTAALMNQQFGQQYSASLGPPPAPGAIPAPTPYGGRTMAPFSAGPDLLQIGLIGGGVVVLLGLTWFLLKD